jgi:hypothetical protein
MLEGTSPAEGTDRRAQGAGRDALDALADQVVDYHSNAANYSSIAAYQSWVVRRLGLDPRRWSGRAVQALAGFLIVFLPAPIVTTLAGRWAQAPWLTWIAIAAFAGVGVLAATGSIRTVAADSIAWIRTIVEEDDLRRVLAWARRWYSHRLLVPVAAVTAIVLSLLVYYLLARRGAAPPIGSLYMGLFVMFFFAQDAFLMVLVAFEAKLLAGCRHQLFPLSPADTIAVRRSLRGYTQLGIVNVLISTPMILGLLLLLPARSGLAVPVVVTLLAVEFICTGLAALAPRVILGSVVRSAKEAEMRVLQERMSELLPRLSALTAEEYAAMKRLEETHAAIRNSPENLLPLGAIARTLGPLLLSAISVLFPAVAPEWLRDVAGRFGP